MLVSTSTIQDKVVAAEATTQAKAQNKGAKKKLPIVIVSDDEEKEYFEKSDEFSEESDDVGECIAIEQ